MAPRTILVNDIICDIESEIRDLPDSIKDIISQDYAVILRKVKPPRRNLSKPEFEALKSLNNNRDI